MSYYYLLYSKQQQQEHSNIGKGHNQHSLKFAASMQLCDLQVMVMVALAAANEAGRGRCQCWCSQHNFDHVYTYYPYLEG